MLLDSKEVNIMLFVLSTVIAICVGIFCDWLEMDGLGILMVMLLAFLIAFLILLGLTTESHIYKDDGDSW